MSADPEVQLRELRKGLGLRPEEIDTRNIAPVLVPSSFFALGNWPGPHVRLRAGEIGLAWAVMLPEETMHYVSFSMAEYWDANNVDWKLLAHGYLQNNTSEELGTHAFRPSHGELYALAFMQSDGIGPSRLLLRDQLLARFPGGYKVAVPEMSCGIAFSVGLEEDELGNIQRVIERCYQGGTRPLAPSIYSPEDLLPLAELR